jgi:hypothetical protein
VNVIYFSHSYREEDVKITKYFSNLIENEKLTIRMDPPSGDFNAAKMVQNLGYCDGMIAVLTKRENGVSPYIQFEINQCIKARKPLLVFIEDTLPDDIIPVRIPQKRFSRHAYYYGAREHKHGVQILKGYFCEKGLPKYHTYSGRKKCLLVGISILPEDTRKVIQETVEDYGFFPLNIDTELSLLIENTTFYDTIASANLAVVYLHDDTDAHHYLAMFEWASVPVIVFYNKTSENFDKNLSGLKYSLCDFSDPDTCKEELLQQISLFEQEYLDLDSEEKIREYTESLIEYGSSKGVYPDDVRTIIIEHLEQLNMANEGGRIQNIRANQIQYNNIWNNVKDNVDFDDLLQELHKIDDELSKSEYKDQSPVKEFIRKAIRAAEAHDGPGLLKLFEKIKSKKEILFDLATKVVTGATASTVVFLLTLMIH